jgi:hypothetical protein
MSCTKLTSQEISYLTRILRLLPDADPIIYTNRVTVLLSSSRTPSSLKRPCRLFTLFRRSTTPDAPLLCALHRRLNASTVHWLFSRLTREVGRHLNSLVLNRQLLNAEQQELVERLRELHALWFRPEDYAKSFLAPPPAGHNCRFQPNGCEACILARVGGDEEVLLDLRTALLSRARTKMQRSEIRRREPTLLLFVEAWLSGLKVGDEYGVLGQTWTDAQALKVVRKRIRKGRARERERERKRRSGAPGLEPELKPQSSRVTDVRDVPDLDNATAAGGSGRDMFGADVENDIIDHYAALTSTLHLSSPVAVSDTTACESESSDNVSGTTRVASAALTRPAEEQARSYQDLLAMPPSLQAESPWDEYSMAREERSRMGGTLASVICGFRSACVVLDEER